MPRLAFEIIRSAHQLPKLKLSILDLHSNGVDII